MVHLYFMFYFEVTFDFIRVIASGPFPSRIAFLSVNVRHGFLCSQCREIAFCVIKMPY